MIQTLGKSHQSQPVLLDGSIVQSWNCVCNCVVDAFDIHDGGPNSSDQMSDLEHPALDFYDLYKP